MEYYTATKKNEIMPFAATGMDLEIVILSEVKSDRERHISYDIIHMWNLFYVEYSICGMIFKNYINELIYKKKNRLTDIKNKVIVTKGETWGGEG